jgi:hypothetical protein
MLKYFMTLATVLVILSLCPPIDAQTGQPKPGATNAASAPAPRRDLSGIWDPLGNGADGIQAFGAKNMPSDGKPEHELPFTPAGLAAWKANKPGFGVTEVPAWLTNDPINICDPGGFPRMYLYELRTIHITQTPKNMMILHLWEKRWRAIRTDGWQLQKQYDEPRWYGYSSGRWLSDNEFVVDTNGTDERTWLDNAGRPHSADLSVQERWVRVNRDRLELTLTINDPVMYSKPWVALDKFPFRLMPDDFDIREMICSPTETAEYNKIIGKPVSDFTPVPAR